MKKLKIKPVVDKIENIELTGEVQERQVKKSGNSARVNIEKKHIGKTVYVVIPKED